MRKLTSELMNEYGIIKLDEDFFAIGFMKLNAKEIDYDSDIVYIDNKVGELEVNDGDTLIVVPISLDKVQIWNVEDYKHYVIIDGYMGSDDSTFDFLNSLGRWFLEHKNIDVDVTTDLYFSEEEMLNYIDFLENL